MNNGIIDTVKKMQHIRTIKKAKANGRDYVGYIVSKRLNIADPDFLKYIIEGLKEGRVNDYQLERLIKNGLSLEIIINNEEIYNYFVDRYVRHLNETFNNSFSSLYSDTITEIFNELLKLENFKNDVTAKVNIQELGDGMFAKLFQDYSNIYTLSLEKVGLLTTLGYTVNEEQIIEGLINMRDTYARSRVIGGLTDLNLFTPAIGDALYKQKFEMLKKWCLSDEENPPELWLYYDMPISPDNKMAQYWRNMDAAIGDDAMTFIMSLIREYAKTHDAFGDKSVELIFKDWKEKNYWYENPRKAFYDDFDVNVGRLFDHDGLPKDLLFSDDRELYLLRKILYYNYEGSKGRYNQRLIDFFIANIERIPEEYQFIFKKLAELSANSTAQEKFLALITNNHYMQEDQRLYDENGLNERFYDAVLFQQLTREELDMIAPGWESHYDENELAYLDKYCRLLGFNTLWNAYNAEEERYRRANPDASYDEVKEKFPWMNLKGHIAHYFENGKPKDNLLIYMLTNIYERNLFKDHPELKENLNPKGRSYLDFLEAIDYNREINLTAEEIETYFDEKGPKLELCKYFFDQNKYEYILITKLPYENILSSKETLVIKEYEKIDDYVLKVTYTDYMKEHLNEIDEDKIKLVSTVLQKISKSNSLEMINLRSQLATQILATDNPIENLNKIEQIFLKNNIPTVGKIFSVFDILHPQFKGFNMEEGSMVSPLLKKRGNDTRKIIIFSDLLRAAFGSNNRSLIKYLKNIREGHALYSELKRDPKKQLTAEEEQILKEYVAHLATMFANTTKGKNSEIELSGDFVEDIDYIAGLVSPDGSLDYNLPDRIIDMFCHFAGITTLEQAEQYLHNRIVEADQKNRARTTISLEQGDFIKGIGGVQYLGHILQNGSVSKEYLGAYSSSDLTPLDTDVSMIMESGLSIEEAMNRTEAKSYGPIWFVLKTDDRFVFSRRSPSDPNQEVQDHYGITKLEAFYTGAIGSSHYGIRTGFSSSDIDCIIVDSYDKRIGLEIAMNGFYIPVFDKKGTRVFTPEDYDLLRSKMSGIEYFNAGEYQFSDDLLIPGVAEMARELPSSREDIIKKRTAIYKAIKEALKEQGLDLKLGFDGDLSEGTAELIDTGSTGRFTNMPGDGDFDFMLKLDRKVHDDANKMQKIKEGLLKAFSHDDKGVIGSGDFRLKGVELPDLTMTVDIDITFEPKTDKVEFSTDEALKQRLEAMREQDREKYLLVVSNILLAKKLLKQYEVYKPNRGEVPQGGLGGVGIENWIIQNGGSLKKAAESFLEAAEGKSFEEFQKTYVIWDFGENHLVTRRNIYPHDNFVYNMSAEGYDKMKKVLKVYLQSLKEQKEELTDRMDNDKPTL